MLRGKARSLGWGPSQDSTMQNAGGLPASGLLAFLLVLALSSQVSFLPLHSCMGTVDSSL